MCDVLEISLKTYFFSMTRKGTLIDDLLIESWHSLLKKKILYNNDIMSLENYLELVEDWIELYSNDELIVIEYLKHHSRNDYKLYNHIKISWKIFLEIIDEEAKKHSDVIENKLHLIFTEQRVAMHATVLRTTVAEEVSIRIMDAFVTIRKN